MDQKLGSSGFLISGKNPEIMDYTTSINLLKWQKKNWLLIKANDKVYVGRREAGVVP